MEFVRVGCVLFAPAKITSADLDYRGADALLPSEDPQVLVCFGADAFVFKGESAALVRKYLLHHTKTDLETRFGSPPAREPSAADLVDVATGDPA